MPDRVDARVPVDVGGRTLQLETRLIAPGRLDAPLLLFLHEGLGSVSAWREFPDWLCEALGWRGLVYSRPGYGRSTPRASGEHWGPDFMHHQARAVLPALLQAMGLAHERPWLLGHSDGASIALLHAAVFPDRVAGLVLMAPHVMVEALTLESIHAVRHAWDTTDLRERLGRHHADPASAFLGWNDAWLDPAFAAWDIRPELASIRCPVLAIQGEDDEYGTLAQLHAIAERVSDTRLQVLPACGHAPHRDQARAVTDAIVQFTRRSRQNAGPRAVPQGEET